MLYGRPLTGDVFSVLCLRGYPVIYLLKNDTHDDVFGKTVRNAVYDVKMDTEVRSRIMDALEPERAIRREEREKTEELIQRNREE